ncbi:MAG: hypothetical protein LM570_04195 [Thermocrinis sp.]|nr:hypothetical protein [Thermocrinis sp.]
MSIRLLTDWQAKPELEPEPEPPKNSSGKQGEEEQEKEGGIGMPSEEEEEEQLMEPLEETRQLKDKPSQELNNEEQ